MIESMKIDTIPNLPLKEPGGDKRNIPKGLSSLT